MRPPWVRQRVTRGLADMPAPETFYLICKGLALLGAVHIGHELVQVLALFLWYLMIDLKDSWEDDD